MTTPNAVRDGLEVANTQFGFFSGLKSRKFAAAFAFSCVAFSVASNTSSEVVASVAIASAAFVVSAYLVAQGRHDQTTMAAVITRAADSEGK